jgi:16S rRNA (uracil1498-N3)-methyltransferase
MKLQRFFVKNKAKVGEDLVVADAALSHQLGKVFRMKVGESVVLFDGDGFEYVSTIASLRKDGAVFHIEKSHPSITSPKIALHVYPALIKKDKLEWVLQKATELGAASFHPVIADRSEKLGFDENRAEKIVREATEQSGWGRVPEIFAPVKLEMAVESAENPYVLEAGGKKISEDFPKTISVFIGPEGGWSDAEKEYLSARKIPTISLGEQILRAETASVAIASLFLSF